MRVTYQNNPKSSGFREISPEELYAVSGGVDLVDGGMILTRDRNSDGWVSVSADHLATLGIFGFGADGYLGLGEGFIDSVFGGGPVVTVPLYPDEDGDGEPGITVTPPPIQVIEVPGSDNIYVRLLPVDGPGGIGGGEYVRYTPEYLNWFFDKVETGEYQPISSGEYTKTYNQPSGSVNFPWGVGLTTPSVSYTWNPHQEEP